MATTISGDTGASQVQDNTITTADIQDSAVTASKIQDSAVTAPKVAGANGTSGQLLQSDGDGTMSWTDVSSGTGWELISDTTLGSTTASVEYDLSDYSGYEEFRIEAINLVPTPTSDLLVVQGGVDGASYGYAIYAVGVMATGSSTGAGKDAQATDVIELHQDEVYYSANAEFYLNKTWTNSSYYTILRTSAFGMNTDTAGHVKYKTWMYDTTVNSIKIFFEVDSIASGARFILYGLKV